MIKRFGSQRYGVWTIKYIVSPLQRWLFKLTGGKIFHLRGQGRQILLLTTHGRRTGKDRTTPVFFIRDGSRLVICNVNPGFEGTNPWVLNLRVNPHVGVQIDAQLFACLAREAAEDEINQYWPRLLQIWPAYQVHFAKSGKRAIFVLDRIEG